MVSVILAQRWGLVGILAGTLISTVALPFWIEPLGLYRYGLKLPAGSTSRTMLSICWSLPPLER